MAVEPRVFEGMHSSITIVRTAPEVVLVTMTGHGTGELRPGPLQMLGEELKRGPYTLFIDVRRMPAVSMDVSKDWAQWFAAHRAELRGVHLLIASRLMAMTAQVIQRFAELGGFMTVHDDVAAFNRALVIATCPKLKAEECAPVASLPAEVAGSTPTERSSRSS